MSKLRGLDGLAGYGGQAVRPGGIPGGTAPGSRRREGGPLPSVPTSGGRRARADRSCRAAAVGRATLVSAALLTAAAAHDHVGPLPGESVAPASGATVSPAEPRGRPAPDFRLTTVSGRAVNRDAYAGWILVLYFFDDEGPEATALLREMEFFHGQGHEREIAYLGVSTLPREALAALVEREGIRHDVAQDPKGGVTRAYLPSGGRGVVVVDHRTTVRLTLERGGETIWQPLRSFLKDLIQELRRSLQEVRTPALDWREPPAAPAFSAPDLEGRTHTGEKYRGKPLLIYFFEQDCDYCREATGHVRDLYFRYREQGLQILGVVSRDPGGKLKQDVIVQGLKFPILLDTKKKIRRAFGSLEGNPDLIWVDAKGQVRWREFGTPDELGDLLDLEARILLDEADPDEISTGRYRGFRYCRVCHEPEFRDWLRTPHAVAMGSLIPTRAEQREECIRCHVTGYGLPGGYADPEDVAMANVQCESCHGAGGGHGRPEGQVPTSPAATCLRCHVDDYPLRQRLEVALPWMNHRATPTAETLFAYDPERITQMDRYRRARLYHVTFRRGTEYVGSRACAPCHEDLFRSWEASAHGKALETLRQGGKQDDPTCLGCHTTAPWKLSGYRGLNTPDLAGVGCETCHGPGGDHVEAPEERASATIYGLVADCPTCRTEAVCRACHDPENDPAFEMPADVARAVHPPAP